MRVEHVKVTTTSGFDGIEIIEYLEPVTAHVVVGMNFFKDFLSGFSDFFGGESSTYQDTLRSINETVISEIRKKAFSIGANCVLSLKIDNDEVSAQGKSMMMVTAVGTAAKADFSKEIINLSKDSKQERISRNYFNFLKTKEIYLKELETDDFTPDEKFWNFAKKNKINEFANGITSSYIKLLENQGDYQYDNGLADFKNYRGYHSNDVAGFTSQLSDYLTIIDVEISTRVLYGNLDNASKAIIKNKIVELILETKLIDYSEIIKLLDSEDFLTKKSVIQILKCDKQDYDKNDVALIDKLINKISMTFTHRGTKTTKKKALSSKEKEIWVCECGEENDISKQYCSKCSRDIFGFKSYEEKPAEILEKLVNDLSILKTALK